MQRRWSAYLLAAAAASTCYDVLRCQGDDAAAAAADVDAEALPGNLADRQTLIIVDSCLPVLIDLYMLALADSGTFFTDFFADNIQPLFGVYTLRHQLKHA